MDYQWSGEAGTLVAKPSPEDDPESFDQTLIRVVRATTGSLQEAAHLIQVLRIIARHEEHARELAEAFRTAANALGRGAPMVTCEHRRHVTTLAGLERVWLEIREVVESGGEVTLSWRDDSDLVTGAGRADRVIINQS